MGKVLLEVCVDSAAGFAEAVSGGADRIELCLALGVGGLTPSVGLMRAAADCGVPVIAMIRPRAGDFVFGAGDVAVMLGDITAVREAELAGVVIGASLADGRLDGAVLAELMAEAAGLDVTLHRAIDLVPDWDEALDLAMALGVRRVLTSGRALRAAEGVGDLARAFARVAGRLVVMPGAGVTAQTLPALRGLPLREVHASCSVSVEAGGAARAFGFASGGERRVDRAAVAALKAALADRQAG